MQGKASNTGAEAAAKSSMKPTEENILAATNELFREFGYNGTSMKQVVSRSAATTGSVYHFYPQGKDQLAAAVIEKSGKGYQQIMELILDQAPDLATGVYAIFEAATRVLKETDYIDPCPIGGLAREVASTNPILRTAANSMFQQWIEAATERFQHAGFTEEESKDFATTLVASLEGGFILARTARSPEPLLSIGRTLRKAVESAAK